MRRISFMAASVAALLALCAVSSSAAQKPVPDTRPPPPRAVVASDPGVPHLVDNRLDMSFCTYPPTALRAGVEGCCRMKVNVGADGSARVTGGECTDNVFLLPSRLCLSPQTYLPAHKGGKPVKGTGEMVVSYVLHDISPSLLDVMIAGIFGRRAQPKTTGLPNLCDKRPGDMISSLPASHG